VKDLFDIDLEEVSLVHKGANLKKFLIVKAIGEGAGVGGPRQGEGGVAYCVCTNTKCGYSQKHERSGSGKSTPCSKISCPKCGSPMKGSNTKSLEKEVDDLVKKKRLKILIDSDMTDEGTKISVDGTELTELRSFSFYYFGPSDGAYESSNMNPISCDYTRTVESKGDFSRTENCRLSKSDREVIKSMNEDLKKGLVSILGKEYDLEKLEKAELSDEVATALKDVVEKATELAKAKADKDKEEKDAVEKAKAEKEKLEKEEKEKADKEALDKADVEKKEKEELEKADKAKAEKEILEKKVKDAEDALEKAKIEKAELEKKTESDKSEISKQFGDFAIKMEEITKALKELQDKVPVRKGLGADSEEREEGQKTKLKKIRDSEEYKNARGEKKLSTFLSQAVDEEIEGGEEE